MINESLAHLDNVWVLGFSGLVVDVAQDLDIDFIVKGLRASSDFEVELQMAQMNYAVAGVHTVFLPSASSYSFIAPKFIRDMAQFGSDGLDGPAGCVEAVAGEGTADDGARRRRDRRAPRSSAERLRGAAAARFADMISSAKTMPLSSSAMINRDEILELLEEANNRLPEELRAALAAWERDEFLAAICREGDDILDAARAYGGADGATHRGRRAAAREGQIVTTSEDEARRLRHEVEDYCDQRLGQFEVILDKVLKTGCASRAGPTHPTGAPRARRRRSRGRRGARGGVLRPGRLMSISRSRDRCRRPLASSRRGGMSPSRSARPRSTWAMRSCPTATVVVAGDLESLSDTIVVHARRRALRHARCAGGASGRPPVSSLRRSPRCSPAGATRATTARKSTRSKVTPSTSAPPSTTPSLSSCPWRCSAARGLCRPVPYLRRRPQHRSVRVPYRVDRSSVGRPRRASRAPCHDRRPGRSDPGPAAR